MCEKCFDEEILRFESESEFIAFEKSLDQKANFVKLINTKHKNLTEFNTKYSCENCNQNWWLSIPDNAWRGYFLTEQSAKKHIKDLKDSDNRKRKIL